MARPKKWRRVCCMPMSQSFGPLETEVRDRNIILMTVDEYESIRLIDLEGMTQEECAEVMTVARTTAQAIYNSARKKLAEALVNGKELHINGGDFVICNGEPPGCGCNHCHKRRCQQDLGDENNE
ncbi:MAG: DUF134 domain-containing protein [Bacillota bacterium]|nr:DUF134 domain-containing protein [Bacillota bacterium]